MDEKTLKDLEHEAIHEDAILMADVATQELMEQNKLDCHADARSDKERQELVAEAHRLTGRIEAFEFTTKLATIASLQLLKSIKERKIYKEIPTVETWENYCKSIGVSRRHIDEQLENLATLGEDFSATVATFGLSYRDLRALRKATKNDALVIKGDEVIIDGEAIPLDDKDYLKEVLEDVISNQQKQLKSKDDAVKQYAEQAETATKARKAAEEKLEKAENKAEAFKQKLNKMWHGRLKDIDPADREQFQDIASVENDFNKIIATLTRIDKAEDDMLSEFNGKMLCAVVSKMMIAIDDMRINLTAKYQYSFDQGFADDSLKDEEHVTPMDFLLED